MTDRRQHITRIVIVAGVIAAIVMGWGASREAANKGRAREATETARTILGPAARYNERRARAWLAEDPARGRDFAALEAFLSANDVAGIVPSWSLLLTDPARLRRCGGSAFGLAPRGEWPNIVPALQLVRDHVQPAIGEVRVVSVRRDPAMNACAGGAAQSRHLSFAALDMVPIDVRDARAAFTRLCAAWRRAGRPSEWGLGAYFDPNRPTQNTVARFHVDATGWRTWGFTRRGPSSGCHALR